MTDATMATGRIQTAQEQRKALRLLQWRSNLLIDRVMADLPSLWHDIVLAHAEHGVITPKARRAILRACEAELAKLEPALTILVGVAQERARALPREAVEG